MRSSDRHRGGLAPLVLFCALTLTACADPVVGEWKTDERVACDRRGKMTLYDDLTGDGEIPLSMT